MYVFISTFMHIAYIIFHHFRLPSSQYIKIWINMFNACKPNVHKTNIVKTNLLKQYNICIQNQRIIRNMYTFF